jgi:hypothetical protein
MKNAIDSFGFEVNYNSLLPTIDAQTSSFREKKMTNKSKEGRRKPVRGKMEGIKRTSAKRK